MQTYRLMWGVVLMVVIGSWMGWDTPEALAQRARVPQTGQTECWDAAGSLIPCDATGQDGDIQAGVELPTPRFTDRRNSTVRDNLTGLIWLKQVNCFSIAVPWVQALINANTLASGRCGLTDGSVAGDWRLPNMRELQSLIDFSLSDPALSNTAGTGHWTSGDPFVGDLTALIFWTSTSRQGNPLDAWVVYMNGGFTQVFPKTNETTVRVWPVRGGK
jgi:hypothetical protein